MTPIEAVVFYALVLFGMTGTGELQWTVLPVDSVEQCVELGRTMMDTLKEKTSFADAKFSCITVPMKVNGGIL